MKAFLLSFVFSFLAIDFAKSILLLGKKG